MENNQQPSVQQEDKPEKLDSRTVRVIGLFALVLGMVCLLWMWYAHSTGDSISQKILLAGPLVTCIGLITLVEPRFMLAMFEPSAGLGKAFKVGGFVMYGIGILLSLMVRFTLFKDWH